MTIAKKVYLFLMGGEETCVVHNVWSCRICLGQIESLCDSTEKARVHRGVMERAHSRDAHCACDWCKLAYDRSDMPQTREALT